MQAEYEILLNEEDQKEVILEVARIVLEEMRQKMYERVGLPKSSLLPYQQPNYNQQCSHPSHNSALGLYVPPGSSVTITCPGCGAQSIIYGCGGVA